jgi:hypothetical protein
MWEYLALLTAAVVDGLEIIVTSRLPWTDGEESDLRSAARGVSDFKEDCIAPGQQTV